MRLLMISGDRSILSGKKGAFWYTLESFSKEWERIDIICPYVKGASSTAVYFGNVYFHPCPKGLWYQSTWIKKQGQKLIEHYRHHVMTVHEYPPFYNGFGARALSKKTGVPHVLEIHHIIGHPVAASFIEWVGRWLSWFILPYEIKRAQGTRVVAKSVAETLMRWGVPQFRLRVVPSFYLDPSLPAEVGDPPMTQYDIVFCGRLVANKGLDDILKAVASLPKVTLLVVGDGPEKNRLKKYAEKLGITPRVEFRGWLPTLRDVLRAVKSAKVLVMNSTSEGGPRIVLEAMAVAQPVIVTNVGVMPDVIIDGQNGLLTTGEPDDLALKIMRVLNDEELAQRMGENAKSVLERFEREMLIARYAGFLKSFVE